MSDRPRAYEYVGERRYVEGVPFGEWMETGDHYVSNSGPLWGGDRPLLAEAPQPRVLLRGWVCDEGGGYGGELTMIADDDEAVCPDYGTRLVVMLDTAQRVCPVCRIERYDTEEDVNDEEAETIGPFGMSARCPKCGSDATPVVIEDTEATDRG